jgi:hypothetical protein
MGTFLIVKICDLILSPDLTQLCVSQHGPWSSLYLKLMFRRLNYVSVFKLEPIHTALSVTRLVEKQRQMVQHNMYMSHCKNSK